ncbi:spermidine synthase [Condylostylus longicornis]|uniref:spermidine synthase n=1 Tax=Condylostylus longicornis TaxID=2530218 RepID=UPI00244DC34E|nr:spermidine synthase [Condylostylus longicornis]
MDVIHNGWFSEIQNELWPGQCFSLKVKKILHEEKSKFQDIKIIETTNYGNCLILDGIIQCTERDEFSYQEMISFIPLCCHSNPKKVLIVGGGDGGVAREVLKHPLVEEIHQIEIDERVVELSKKYLPHMAIGFKNPKLKLTIGDGFEYMKNHINEFDVIITDSSDPVGPAVSLFQENYFSLMRKALRPGGIVCSQGGTFWTDLQHVKETIENCKKQFPNVGHAVTAVPSYPCGQIGFIIGSLNIDQKLCEPVKIFSKEEIDNMNLRYYTSDIHKTAFTLPRYVEKTLYEK